MDTGENGRDQGTSRELAGNPVLREFPDFFALHLPAMDNRITRANTIS